MGPPAESSSSKGKGKATCRPAYAEIVKTLERCLASSNAITSDDGYVTDEQKNLDSVINKLQLTFKTGTTALKYRRNQMSYINRLPDEVLREIFRYLDPIISKNDLECNSSYMGRQLHCTWVCRRWRNIILNDPFCWRWIDFHFSDCGIEETLRRAKTSIMLRLTPSNKLWKKPLHLLKAVFENASSIDFGETGLSERLIDLIKFTPHLKQLKKLTFAGNSVEVITTAPIQLSEIYSPDESKNVLTFVTSTLKNIQLLHLHLCESLDFEDLSAFLSSSSLDLENFALSTAFMPATIDLSQTITMNKLSQLILNSYSNLSLITSFLACTYLPNLVSLTCRFPAFSSLDCIDQIGERIRLMKDTKFLLGSKADSVDWPRFQRYGMVSQVMSLGKIDGKGSVLHPTSVQHSPEPVIDITLEFHIHIHMFWHLQKLLLPPHSGPLVIDEVKFMMRLQDWSNIGQPPGHLHVKRLIIVESPNWRSIPESFYQFWSNFLVKSEKNKEPVLHFEELCYIAEKTLWVLRGTEAQFYWIMECLASRVQSEFPVKRLRLENTPKLRDGHLRLLDILNIEIIHSSSSPPAITEASAATGLSAITGLSTIPGPPATTSFYNYLGFLEDDEDEDEEIEYPDEDMEYEDEEIDCECPACMI